MLRWLGPKKPTEPPDRRSSSDPAGIADEEFTDDPLAAISILDTRRKRGEPRQVYSVSRVNPLFLEPPPPDVPKPQSRNVSHQSSPSPAYKSNSSGYGGSQGGSSMDALYLEQLKLQNENGVVLDQNPAYVRSIRVARGRRNAKTKQKIQVPSMTSSSSGNGTLTTIPEGRVDLPIPKPIWPLDEKFLDQYDSLVDDALLLYTSLNQSPEKTKCLESYVDLSVKDLLVELLNHINATLEGKTGVSPEDMLRNINDRLLSKLETLRNATEDEMKKLCINLSNCRKMNSVLRAFSNSSSSGNSTQSVADYSSGRVRTVSSETEDIYQIPSGSSSSGFSDSVKEPCTVLPVFVHHDNFSGVPNGVRNAMIYGTLMRDRSGTGGEKLLERNKTATVPKKSLLMAVNDNKPSVWEQYYGMKANAEGVTKQTLKPSDVPIFPGGRPEADFTLDVPRSELLSKKMREDKKWRFRCRLLTSFLGLVFFLLSVMAVSLMLTRGKRMFGSMV
ncbi:uncharacterized protein LOC109607509 isoform X2 [Aethina tumida]|uniref:uncharacterized protein LOC109607509 isoform X2 n=1 Tax=Aethina tumida TaxID=116153 RepID=UPI0021497340|nr:uncharacterized protein LOC109607509 isoform X2 [Aethina tumida]